MNVSEVKKLIKDEDIREIIRKIDNNQVKEDEWADFLGKMTEYVNTDIPEDVKRLFYPLGYIEMATIMVDGITRWKKSICIRCERQQNYQNKCCELYPQGIPPEIWAADNAKCNDYKK